MVKFFIITDILHFFPLVGVSLSLFSFCNLPSLSSCKDFQWSGPPNCSKRLWREAQDGNLETFSCWQRPTFNIFWQLFLWSNSCIFLALSNIFFNVGDTNTLHILLLFKSLGPCNQRSTCRLTLTCFRQSQQMEGEVLCPHSQIFEIRCHLWNSCQWRSQWALVYLEILAINSILRGRVASIQVLGDFTIFSQRATSSEVESIQSTSVP